MEQYASIQQLLKKEEGEEKRLPIYPPTVIQAVFDAKTGAPLEAVLAQYNAIYVQYQGTPEATRNIIPKEMRRAGLIITYMNMNSETITERANFATQMDNDHWGLDINWSRIDELSLSGDISVSVNGTWIINGKDTKIAARGPKGDTGLTPWLKTINNKLHFSYDNIEWEQCSENIAAWFRFNATSSDSQNGTIGKVQISRDNKTWTDLSPEFRNNIRIQGYVATTSALPANQVVGTIYGVGPTYAADDTAHTNPIYRLHVWNGASWVDNGQFTSIAAGVVQETGNSETEVMSQKATTEKLTELASKVIKKKVGTNLFNKDSEDNISGYFITSSGNLQANASYVVSHYIPVSESLSYYQRYGSNNTYWALYDSNFNVIKTDLVNSIPSTVGACYLRITIPTTRVWEEQVEVGDSFTSYYNYTELYNKITEEDIKNLSVSESKMSTNSISIPDLWELGMPESNSYKNRIRFRDYIYGDDFTVNNATITSNEYFTSANIQLAAYDKDYKLLSTYGGSVKLLKDSHPDAVWFKPWVAGVNGSSDNIDSVDWVRHIQFNSICWCNIIRDNSITSDKLKDNSISVNKLEDSSVSPQKATFFGSVNLINKVDDDVALGMYISAYGVLSSNSGYNTTGYIPVYEGKHYYIGSFSKIINARFICCYDKDKKALSSLFLQSVNEFTVAEGVAFVRMSLPSNYWDYAQLSVGKLMPYSDYKLAIKSEYLPGNLGANTVDFYLPKNIYVAAGRTIELYYDQIILNAHKYNIQAICPVGKSLERKFQIIGDNSKLGTYTLTVNVYNDLSDIIASGTSTVHIVSSAIASQINVMPIGDSLTNGKAWLSELGNLSLSKIKTVGTRQGKHEGRSGANVSTYTSVSGDKLYTYDNFYTGIGSDAPIFSESTSYSKDTLVRYPYEFGNGVEGYEVYVFTTNHSAGSWNANEVYCISGGNPFYDFRNLKFSMNFYKSFYNISYDVIMIYLGTNGISLTPETNQNGALGIKNLIELIRQEDTTSPIVVVNTIFRSGQNGIGNQGNTDGYKAQSAYKYDEDRKILLLGKALEEMVGSMDNVYLCPVGFTHDSKYNFGNSKVSVNPRFTSIDDVFELQPLDSVHPQECGYLQMADEMFSTICAIFQ